MIVISGLLVPSHMIGLPSGYLIAATGGN